MKEAKPQQMPEGRAGAACGPDSLGGSPRSAQLRGWHSAPASCLSSGSHPWVTCQVPTWRGGRRGCGELVLGARCTRPSESCRPHVSGTFFFYHLMTFGLMSVPMIFAALSSQLPGGICILAYSKFLVSERVECMCFGSFKTRPPSFGLFFQTPDLTQRLSAEGPRV